MSGKIELLIDTAVSVFNSQYGKKYKASDFLARNIEPNGNTVVAFELWTRRTDDDFIIRLYCYMGDYFRVFPYKVLYTPPDDTYSPNKRIFEAYVMITEKYPLIRIVLIAEDGVTPLMSEAGQFMIPELA